MEVVEDAGYCQSCVHSKLGVGVAERGRDVVFLWFNSTCFRVSLFFLSNPVLGTKAFELSYVEKALLVQNLGDREQRGDRRFLANCHRHKRQLQRPRDSRYWHNWQGISHAAPKLDAMETMF